MIKPPGIIDNTIELPGRCYAIRMMPHEVDIADIHDWNQTYVDAMKLIVDGNVDEGKEILEELYRRKYNRAGHTLSYGYGAGWFGEPDSKKYLSLVYALVLKGYSAAFSDYGFCYDCGIGVKKSMRWALYWYRKAADYDDEAQNILELCYEEGLGVLKDYEKAYYWFQLAVKNGAGACAEHNLARCFRLGRGISEDKEMANKYEALAVKHGFHKKDKGIVI